MLSSFRRVFLGLALGLLSAASAVAADLPQVELSIKDHRFEPARITIPAGRKVVLVVHNRDATPEEFESNEFNREKVILGGRTARIYVGPLQAGSYRFFGEFHADSAQGVLVVEE
jgi:plastocyanin